MNYMAVEVSLEQDSFGRIKRVLALDKRRPDAEAIANMAVMRRGVENSFFDVRPMTAENLAECPPAPDAPGSRSCDGALGSTANGERE